MKSIQTQAIITGVRSKVDRSLGLTVATPELSTDEKALFMELQGINTEMTITPLEEHIDEVEVIKKETGSKTSSQRLRAVLFIFWKQQGEKGTFDEFYMSTMEKLIDHYKAKLED